MQKTKDMVEFRVQHFALTGNDGLLLRGLWSDENVVHQALDASSASFRGIESEYLFLHFDTLI